MPYQPAVLGTARLNNFRLNYLTAQQAAERLAKIWILIGGVDATARVIYKSLTIRDLLFDAPNTCALTMYGTTPNVGQPIEVWINRNAPQLLFNGELQTVERTYKGRPTTVLHPVTAIDDTARANRRRPLRPYVNVSATAIAQDLIATYAPGFSSAGVEAGLPAVTINFDGSEGGMKGCLTALAKLIGGYWYFENKTLYLFLTPPGTAPDPIDETPGRFLHDPAITWAIDKSQVRTRVYGKGASTRIVASIGAGEFIVPLENGEMFNPAGGQAIAGLTPEGAASRVLTYTGVQLGGGGGLVGPGAAPSAAPGVTLNDFAGMESGAHGYAITFTTAAGESLPGPQAVITVGLTPAPSLAPVPGTATAGGSIDPGTYQYGITFVTNAGETTLVVAGPAVTTSLGVGVPTPGGSGAVVQTVTGNLASGVAYRYETTFTTASGETLPGAPSSLVQPQPPPAPTGIVASGGTVGPVAGGPATPYQTYFYHLAFTTTGYETAISPVQPVSMPVGYTAVQFTSIQTSADPRVTGRRLYRQYNSELRLLATFPDNTPGITYTDVTPDASLGPVRTPISAAIGTPPGTQATVTIPTSTDGRVVGRRIYRSDAGAPFRRLTTISNNTATQYIDNTTSVATDPDAPTSDTTGGANYQTVPLTGIMVGPTNVQARNLYRWRTDLGWRFVATIANNTATTYTDTKANAALGGTGPATNTAVANQTRVTLPLGGATVTGRKLYRTKANLTALLYLNTIADNTSTLYGDNAPDSALGAAPPVTDTSGLVQPNGQVPAGATSLILANPAPFAAGGGWAVIGNGDQVIRYTGISATALTGVPSSGPGAIVASISYNSTVTAAPALIGVSGILEAVIRNAPIHVWIQRDDLAAQAYMAALDGGGDGVYEHIWSDERRAEASLRQVCDAQLKLYSRPLVTVTYASRDLKTKSGKTVAIALATPAINESLTIQEVTISELGITGLMPKFTVTASTARQSFESILQMLIRKADA